MSKVFEEIRQETINSMREAVEKDKARASEPELQRRMAHLEDMVCVLNATLANTVGALAGIERGLTEMAAAARGEEEEEEEEEGEETESRDG